MRRVRFGGACAVLALLLSLSVAAVAQDNGTAAPQGRRGQRGQGRQVTVAMVPVSALATELNLTADQKTKLTDIQTKYQDAAKALRPAPGTPPDPANRQKMMDLTRQANQDMEVVLNDTQKQKLPETLQEFSTVRAAGIPLEVYSDLKLTDDQKRQIADISKDFPAEDAGSRAGRSAHAGPRHPQSSAR